MGCGLPGKRSSLPRTTQHEDTSHLDAATPSPVKNTGGGRLRVIIRPDWDQATQATQTAQTTQSDGMRGPSLLFFPPWDLDPSSSCLSLPPLEWRTCLVYSCTLMASCGLSCLCVAASDCLSHIGGPCSEWHTYKKKYRLPALFLGNGRRL